MVDWAEAFALVASARVVPRVAPPVPITPYPKVFIGGCGRSGTTWVRDLFKAHPQVVTGPESHVYRHVHEPLAAASSPSVRALSQVLFFDDEGRRRRTIDRVHHYVSRRTLRQIVRWAASNPGWTGEQAGSEMVAAVLAAFRSRASGTRATMLVEKSPEHLLIADRILSQFPEAVMIEVVRDGRDTCVSKYRQWVAKGVTSGPMTDEQRDYLMTKWSTYVSRGMELRADPPLAGRIRRIRYEDLRADTEPEIAALLEFAGLADVPGRAAELRDATDFSRIKVRSEKHFRSGVVGDFRNHLDAADEARFRELAGDVFEAAGYEW